MSRPPRLRAVIGSLVAAFVIAANIFTGCGGDSTSPGPPPDCTSVADTSQPATVTYTGQIAALIDHYACATAGCHGSIGTRSRYTVVSYDDLFDPGEQATALRVCAIRPGMPDSSYFYWKLEGHAGIRGVQMPNDRPKLTPEHLAMVRTWIEEGAR
ncbi:MAG TPA: hypothetical protein VF720_03095 [Candidatus Eisenbacteria bacterium]